MHGRTNLIHVLLILLKFLGIFLLFLLGLIVLVLAAPIRYSFHFHAGEEASFGGQIKVTWLLGILYIRGSYIEKIFEYRVRIFGYQILGNQKEFLEKKQKRERKKQKKRNKKSEKSNNKENVPVFYRTLFCYLCVDFTVCDDIQPGAVCGEAYNAEFSLGVSAGAGRKYVLGAADSQ